MIDEDEYNELLHWLAYNYPGVYRIWSDKKNNDDMIDKYQNQLNKEMKQ